jgi:hypothetical protein
MPRRKKKDEAAELAGRMVQVLEAQRRLGSDSYSLTLRRLAELTDPAAPPELVRQAIAKRKEFAARVVAAHARDLDAPVALAEDVDQLADSPLLLEFVLNLVCTPDRPTCSITQLKSKVPTKLKKPFEAALRRRIEENTLPPTVGVVKVKGARKNQVHLHLRRYPLPPEPDRELAENLVQVLRAQRQLGGDSYPLLLGRLVELACAGADPALVKQAIARPEFQNEAVLALKIPSQVREVLMETPVALASDSEQLADSPLLLEAALKAVRSATKQIATIADLKKKLVASLQRPFGEAVSRRIDEGSLPPTVGCLLQARGKRILFLMSDVITGPAAHSAPAMREEARPAASPPPAAPEPAAPVGTSPGFVWAFDQAFRRLEQRQRIPNFVSLVDLRRALPFDRATFDAGLDALRRAGRYTLSAAEGRYGITPEEQEAGIVEDGTLLLYVSRKLS